MRRTKILCLLGIGLTFSLFLCGQARADDPCLTEGEMINFPSLQNVQWEVLASTPLNDTLWEFDLRLTFSVTVPGIEQMNALSHILGANCTLLLIKNNGTHTMTPLDYVTIGAAIDSLYPGEGSDVPTEEILQDVMEYLGWGEVLYLNASAFGPASETFISIIPVSTYSAVAEVTILSTEIVTGLSFSEVVINGTRYGYEPSDCENQELLSLNTFTYSGVNPSMQTADVFGGLIGGALRAMFPTLSATVFSVMEALQFMVGLYNKIKPGLQTISPQYLELLKVVLR